MSSPSVDDYVQGVLTGDRALLARAITLVESSAPRDREAAQAVLHRLLPKTGRALRIGITGAPGAGKSTFIEAFGSFLTAQGKRVAVLAVDPSSQRTGGSILGDKTRMDRLSRDERAFIRPSPSGETLGGVARKTREALLICEAAGFDVVIVETVGVGQNEIAVRSMVDFFLLMLLPGGGDELQGIKKGIVELADALFVNKADGKNVPRAQQTRMEYESALKYVAPATPRWQTKTLIGSALEEKGIDEVFQLVERFYKELGEAGVIGERRSQQTLNWLSDLIRDELHTRFFHDGRVRAALPALEADVLAGRKTVTTAVADLFQIFDRL
jgi:LAO/AO transport system kinase